MAHLPMECLIEDLNKVFTEQPKTDERTSQIKLLLSAYVKEGHKDWKKYVYFNDVHYTRNLVKMTDDFELMVNENYRYKLLLLINVFRLYAGKTVNVVVYITMMVHTVGWEWFKEN